MEITYKKINNTLLFKDFENDSLLQMSNCQNYVPLYNKFFSLNSNNYNSINLNNHNTLSSITKKITENIYEGTVKNDKEELINKNVFFKFSPLLDPFKYMAGKYNINDENLLNLPKFNITSSHKKIYDENNSAYVDSFFTYLTSQLLNKNNFIHGIDFYGSYLGHKNNYHVDIGDDIDMLCNNNFFHKNINTLFSFLNSEHEEILGDDSRSNKKRLHISNDNDDVDINVLNLEDITSIDITSLDSVSTNHPDINNNQDTNIKSEIIYEDNNMDTNSLSSSSEVSSRSSNTENSDSDNSEDTSEDTSEGSSSLDEETIMMVMKKFPVQVIALEKCENTLDDLFVNDKLNEEELSSAIIQILMMLITYQRVFNLTHNDLHTNNIMYVETDKKFLYYKVDDRHYKVKTHGKIYKIIDYGRAIYSYKNQLICSDSFHKEGDAATQYNFKPYYNEKKTTVEPNFSFDLCRLGCAIYDFITEKYDDIVDIKWSIHKIIMNWCQDDDNRNILYKNNDEERYPDFKLYKMIARKVNNHVPINELKNKYFEKYIVSKKEIKKGANIMNLDTIKADSIKQIILNQNLIIDDCD